MASPPNKYTPPSKKFKKDGRARCRYNSSLRYPSLDDLTLPDPARPATRGARKGTVTFDVEAHFQSYPKGQPRLTKRQVSRITRTKIKVSQSRAFVRELLGEVGAEYQSSTPNSREFTNPYNGEILTLPSTMEELLFLYQMLGEYHEVCSIQDEDLVDSQDYEDESKEEGELIEEKEGEPEEVVPGEVRGDMVTSCVAVKAIVEGEVLDHQQIYGPIQMTTDQMLTLAAGGEAAIDVFNELFPGVAEGSRYIVYEAGLYEGTRQCEMTPVTSGGSMNTYAPLYATTGYANPTSRLSYSDADHLFIDHPMLEFSKDDVANGFEASHIKDPYLRQNFVPDVCWMSCVIEIVNTNSKRVQLTYDKLWSIMGHSGVFDPVEAQAGISVEDMIPVFEYYDRNVYILDGSNHNQLCYSRARSEDRRHNHVRPETWRFLITEHHVYPMLSCVNINLREHMGFHHSFKINRDSYNEEVMCLQHPYERVSPMLPRSERALPLELRKRQEINVVFLEDPDAEEPQDEADSLENLLFSPMYNDVRVLLILVEGSLLHRVVLPLLRDYSFKPNIYYNGKEVSSVSISSFSDRGMILFRPMNALNRVSSADELFGYKQAGHDFYQALLSHGSTFNEDTISILHSNVRGGLCAWTSHQQRAVHEEQELLLNSVDANRLYPSTLMCSTLPVVSVFDSFEPFTYGPEYNECEDHDLFVVCFYDTSTIYSDRSVALCFKHNLDLFISRPNVSVCVDATDVPGVAGTSDGQTFVVFQAILRTKPVPCLMGAYVEQTWSNQELPRHLRKLAMNASIGKMGTTMNIKYKSGQGTPYFTTLIEAQTFVKENPAHQLLPTCEDVFICSENSERVPRLQGGYLIHLWVLDSARMRMQLAYDKLVDAGVDVTYIRCDELFYPASQQHLVDPFIFQGDCDSLGAFGKLKQGQVDKPCSELYFRRLLIGEFTEPLYPSSDSVDQVAESVQFSYRNSYSMNEVIPHPSEYNISNIADYKRLLVKACVPGAGKSHSVLGKFASSTLVVCPTNALCVEFKSKYPGCETMTLHKFLQVGVGKEHYAGSKQSVVCEDSMEDTTEYIPASAERLVEHNKVLLFDEIYMYSFELLVRLKYRLELTNASAIYATGDIHQLPPVNEEFGWMREQRIRAINYLFPNQMMLTKCKRMTSEVDNRSMENLCREIISAKSLHDVKLLIRMSFRDLKMEQAVKMLKEDQGSFLAVCYYNRTCHVLAAKVLGKKVKEGTVLVNRKRLQVKGKTLQVNYEYVITEVTPKFVTLRPITGETDEESTALIEMVPHAHVHRNMHWTRTRTCHSLQGSSVSGKLLMFDFSSPHITQEFLYVALTRARELSEVYIVAN